MAGTERKLGGLATGKPQSRVLKGYRQQAKGKQSKIRVAVGYIQTARGDPLNQVVFPCISSGLQQHKLGKGDLKGVSKHGPNATFAGPRVWIFTLTPLAFVAVESGQFATFPRLVSEFPQFVLQVGKPQAIEYLFMN